MEIAETTWRILVQLSPWLVLGMVLSGAMHVLLPADLIRKKFRGTRGVINAVLLGVPLPLCSCGVVPAGIGLKNDGADDGASVGFLISTPQTGVDSILVSAGFFGWPFAVFKMVAAAVTGIAGGLLADKTGSEPENSIQQESAGCDSHSHSHHRNSGAGILVRAWDHGTEVVRSVWIWLLAGVLVSALIQTVVPEAWFQSLENSGLFLSMLAVLLISVPLYVCATASVPIASGLVAGGLPPAAALVFLMAGPATNVTTIAAVYGRFGLRILMVYLGTIIVGSMLFALVFDWTLSATVVGGVHATHDHGDGWFSITCACALLLLIGWFILDDILRWNSNRKFVTADGSADAMTVDVEGMHCNSCVSRLEKALGQLDGAERVAVHLSAGTASVTGDVPRDKIVHVINDLGFSVPPEEQD